jgi:alpha-aminoadipic semialdehyde synthase
MVVMLKGHLFDSGLINQILDVLEQHNCAFEFEECYVRYPQAKGKRRVKSSAVLVITGSHETDLAVVEAKIEALVNFIKSADASFQRVDRRASGGAGEDTDATQSVVISGSGQVRVTNESQKTVLLLGAGRVSASVVELLGCSNDRTIVVASNDEKEARGIAAGAVRGRHACLDVNDHERLSELLKEADIVISLLPAHIHPQVAELCINNHKNLVTASYESDKMRELGMRYVQEDETAHRQGAIDCMF